MLTLRPAHERGHFDHGWLDTHHTFSFGAYHDPRRMGFRTLRVINDDRVAPGQGFPMHGHRDMEIVTVVLEGELAHRDSLGHGATLTPGMVQRMSAGTGIRHSEFNPSPDRPLHLYQIWLTPERDGLPPSYEDRAFPPDVTADRLGLLASRDGAEGSLVIHQDLRLYRADLSPRATAAHELAPGRAAWLQVLTGTVEVAGATLAAGDGASLTDQGRIDLTGGREGGSVLLFDLA